MPAVVPKQMCSEDANLLLIFHSLIFETRRSAASEGEVWGVLHILTLTHHLLHAFLSFPSSSLLCLWCCLWASHFCRGAPRLSEVKKPRLPSKLGRSDPLWQCVSDRILEHSLQPEHTSVRMAESTKRQNNKAPVATPNVGQLVTLETAMNGAIGAK